MAHILLPVFLRQHSVRDTTSQWGYPMSDTRSKCVVQPSGSSTFKHAVPKHQSWFLDGGPTCIVHDMASLFIYCVQLCCAGTPLPLLPHSKAILYLTHGGTVYFYHLDVPPSRMLYTGTNPGFWRLALRALSMAWRHCSYATSSIAQQVLRTRYYHAVGLSYISHTVDMCSSTI